MKNLNEQIDRIKQLFSDDRLYGNLVENKDEVLKREWELIINSYNEHGVISEGTSWKKLQGLLGISKRVDIPNFSTIEMFKKFKKSGLSNANPKNLGELSVVFINNQKMVTQAFREQGGSIGKTWNSASNSQINNFFQTFVQIAENPNSYVNATGEFTLAPLKDTSFKTLFLALPNELKNPIMWNVIEDARMIRVAEFKQKIKDKPGEYWKKVRTKADELLSGGKKTISNTSQTIMEKYRKWKSKPVKLSDINNIDAIRKQQGIDIRSTMDNIDIQRTIVINQDEFAKMVDDGAIIHVKRKGVKGWELAQEIELTDTNDKVVKTIKPIPLEKSIEKTTTKGGGKAVEETTSEVKEKTNFSISRIIRWAFPRSTDVVRILGFINRPLGKIDPKKPSVFGDPDKWSAGESVVKYPLKAVEQSLVRGGIEAIVLSYVWYNGKAIVKHGEDWGTKTPVDSSVLLAHNIIEVGTMISFVGGKALTAIFGKTDVPKTECERFADKEGLEGDDRINSISECMKKARIFKEKVDGFKTDLIAFKNKIGEIDKENLTDKQIEELCSGVDGDGNDVSLVGYTNRLKESFKVAEEEVNKLAGDDGWRKWLAFFLGLAGIDVVKISTKIKEGMFGLDDGSLLTEKKLDAVSSKLKQMCADHANKPKGNNPINTPGKNPKPTEKGGEDKFKVAAVELPTHVVRGDLDVEINLASVAILIEPTTV